MAVLRLPPWRLRGRDELQQLLEPATTFGQLPLWQGSDAAAGATAFSHVYALPCMRGGPDEQTLCAAVKRWAMESLEMPPLLQPLELGGVHEFSAAECRRVLAAAFVGNVADTMSDAKRNQGGLNFSKLVRDCALDAESICAHKLAALLLYFAAGLALEGTADDERTVRFERITCPPLADFEAMLTAEEVAGTRPEWSEVVSLHDGGMEAALTAAEFEEALSKLPTEWGIDVIPDAAGVYTSLEGLHVPTLVLGPFAVLRARGERCAAKKNF